MKIFPQLSGISISQGYLPWAAAKAAPTRMSEASPGQKRGAITVHAGVVGRGQGCPEKGPQDPQDRLSVRPED